MLSKTSTIGELKKRSLAIIDKSKVPDLDGDLVRLRRWVASYSPHPLTPSLFTFCVPGLNVLLLGIAVRKAGE